VSKAGTHSTSITSPPPPLPPLWTTAHTRCAHQFLQARSPSLLPTLLPLSRQLSSPRERENPAGTLTLQSIHNAVERQRREALLREHFLQLFLPTDSQLLSLRILPVLPNSSSVQIFHRQLFHRLCPCFLPSSIPCNPRALHTQSDALHREANDWHDRANLPRVEEPVRSDDFAMVFQRRARNAHLVCRGGSGQGGSGLRWFRQTRGLERCGQFFDDGQLLHCRHSRLKDNDGDIHIYFIRYSDDRNTLLWSRKRSVICHRSPQLQFQTVNDYYQFNAIHRSSSATTTIPNLFRNNGQSLARTRDTYVFMQYGRGRTISWPTVWQAHSQTQTPLSST
jgi:hypothetical protein